MTDAHCHVSCGDPTVREFLIGRDFLGIHPWEAGALDPEDARRKTEDLRARLASSVSSPVVAFPGVGEIGLDRLRERNVSPQMRDVFETQLKLALEFHRPVVLHGAKCWGQVVGTIRRLFPVPCSLFPVPCSLFPVPSSLFPVPSFLFHGFSRSDGLIPDIVALNGYMSVGPAILNDHAVNYRELAKKIPLDRLLVETDRTEESAATCPPIGEVAAKLAEIRGVSRAELETIIDRNAERFLGSLL